MRARAHTHTHTHYMIVTLSQSAPRGDTGMVGAGARSGACAAGKADRLGAEVAEAATVTTGCVQGKNTCHLKLFK